MSIDSELSEALLRYLAKHERLDPAALIEWANGNTAKLAPLISRALVRELGLPDGWQPGTHTAIAKPSIARQAGVSGMTRKEWGKALGRSRLAHSNAVYEWMGSAGLNTVALSQGVSKRLGRGISRASLQTYLSGTQSLKGGKKRAVLAPLDVREAVEAISKGRVKVSDWPNAK